MGVASGSEAVVQDILLHQIDPGGDVEYSPGTYSGSVTIDETIVVSGGHGYASAWSLVLVRDSTGATNRLINCATKAPGGDLTGFSFTFTVAADGEITLDSVTVDPTDGVVSLGAGHTAVPLDWTDYHLEIWGSSADSNHGIDGYTQMTWAVPGDSTDPVPPPPPPGDEQEVVDDDDVAIDTFINQRDKIIRVERLGWGSGAFKIRRDAPDADLIGNGHDGRMVKVTIPRIDPDPIFRYMIENIGTVVAHFDEQGEELITVAGRGALAYFDRAVASPYTYVIPSGPVEVHRGPAATGQKAGQILRRTVAEYQHVDRPQHPIPLITVDFDYTNDSNGDPWDTTPDTGEFALGYTGESALNGLQEIWGTGGIDFMLKPDGSMLLQAFNHYGRDLTGTSFGTGVVRFVKGVNIADVLTRVRGTQLPATHAWVEGDNLVFVDPPAELADAGSRPTVESFIHTIGTDLTYLENVGVSALIEGLRRGESVAFNVAIVKSNDLLDEDAGYYLPGPPGTNGHFWIGDTVTISSGTGVDDFDNEDARIEAITLSFDEANNLRCKVEVKATTILGRIPPTTGTPGSFGGGTVGPGSLGGTGGTAPPPVPTSTALTDHLTDTVDAHDASAVSFSPTGTLAATDVQAAIAEAASEAIQKSLLTTQDDIIVRDASAPARLAKGTDGQVLTVDPVTHHLAWKTPSSGSVATDAIWDAKGDLAGGTGADTAARLAVGANGTVLTADSTQTTGLKWGTAPLVDPMTTRGDIIYRDAANATTRLAAGSAGAIAMSDGTDISKVRLFSGIECEIDGGGSVITTGIKGALRVPHDCTITEATILDMNGTSVSAVVDIKKRAFGGGAASSICASAKPTLSSASESTDTTLTGWTTTLSAGDILYFNVDSATTTLLLLVYLKVRRSAA